MAHRDVLTFAPMMEISDHHWRQLMRLITKRTKLYTEMIVAQTILHAEDLDGFLKFDPVQHPIACQVGGNDPAMLAEVAAVVESYGYDELNLNVGCPSNRVATSGCFGARLMLEPETVRDCVAAMQAACSIPVTVKCRLGADDMDSYEEFKHFVEVVAESGVKHFIVHARKCWLKGLSPAQNRSVPPLHYDWIYRIAQEMPHLDFSLNGGVASLDAAADILATREWTRVETVAASAPTLPLPEPVPAAGSGASGEPSTRAGDDAADEKAEGKAGEAPPPGLLNSVMLGRYPSTTPWDFCDVDRRFFGDMNPGLTRGEVLTKYLEYVDEHWAASARPKRHVYLRAVSSMFKGCRGGKQFRTHIMSNDKTKSVRTVVEEAMALMPPEFLESKADTP